MARRTLSFHCARSPPHVARRTATSQSRKQRAPHIEHDVSSPHVLPGTSETDRGETKSGYVDHVVALMWTDHRLSESRCDAYKKRSIRLRNSGAEGYQPAKERYHVQLLELKLCKVIHHVV